MCDQIRLIVCSLVLLLFAESAVFGQAQVEDDYRSPELRLGVAAWGGVANFDAPSVPFTNIILPPDATVFSSGDAFQFGAKVEYAFYPSPEYLFGLQAGIESQDLVSFTATEPTTFIVDLNEVDGLLQHSLDVELTTLSLGPVVGWHLPFLPAVRVSAGLDFAWPLVSDLSQEETIVSPDGQTYPGGEERIQVYAGAWDSFASPRITGNLDLQFTLAALRGGGWEPRIIAGLQQSVRSLDGDVDWGMQSLRLGFAMYQAAAPPRPVFRDTTYLRDTVQVLSDEIEEVQIVLTGSASAEQIQELPDAIYRTLIVRERYQRSVPEERSLLLVGMQVRFVQGNGTESENVKIELEEFIALERFPLLPYIFFEQGSSAIDARYGPAGAARQGNLRHYWAIIDSVAQRLQRNPQARLQLRATALAADESPELATARAQSVREAIMQRAGIDTARFDISIDYPAVGIEGRPELMDELRRVELSSAERSILQPARISIVMRRADPPMLRFYPEVFAEAGIRDWRLEIMHRDQVATEKRGSGEPPVSIDWDLQETQAALGLAIDELRLDHRLTVVDLDGRERSTERGSIDFRRSTPETLIDTLEERYMLAWFGHDEADLLAHHRNELNNIRAAAGKVDSGEITVYGATDSTGSRDYNTRLSARRARGAIDVLGAAARMAAESESGALVIYDNRLPEGRMYNRRVEVILQRNKP